MDAISESRLSGIHPELARRVRALYDALCAEHIYIRVVQGLRTWGEQDELYAQGRTKPGPVVTMAKGGFSYHNYGLAVDVVPSRHGPELPFDPDWDTRNPAWGRIVYHAEGLGLDCGAAWAHFKDYPHLQMTGKLPRGCPGLDARELLVAKGPSAVWQLAGLPA